MTQLHAFLPIPPSALPGFHLSHISILPRCCVLLLCKAPPPPLVALSSLSHFQPPALVQWAGRVPVSSSFSLFHPTVMNQAWSSDIIPTAAAEPLFSLLPSTPHCFYLLNTKKSKEQMSFYSHLQSFYISFASHSKLPFFIEDLDTLFYSFSLPPSSLHEPVRADTHC